MITATTDDESAPTIERPDDFLGRFDGVVLACRRACLIQAACVGFIFVVLAFVVLAAFDFLWELPYAARAVSSSLLGLAAPIGLIVTSLLTSRRVDARLVAHSIERYFPDLGQAVRTVVECRDPGAAGFASPSLVAAMRHDLDEQSTGLPLHEIVPWGRARRALLLLAAITGASAIIVAIHWEWRIAALRTCFFDLNYTDCSVRADRPVVDEGTSATLITEIRGRLPGAVQLLTRPIDRPAESWTSQLLSDEHVKEHDERRLVYQTKIADVREALEYRVVAGSGSSVPQRLSVRFPIEIRSIQVVIAPPAYTGLSPSTVDDGNVVAIAGSQAKLRITLDGPVDTAELRLTAADANESGADADRRIPLDIDGATLTAQIDLVKNVRYSIEGRAANGSRIRQLSYAIRVRQDRPPRVEFQGAPAEFETHALAEVMLRARVDDDHGVSRAGIVFQVNNGEEHALTLFEAQASPDAPAAHAGKRIELKEVLPLESLALTMKDSVAYYAFAEDNAMPVAQRSQSDLQFIDIRPFRRRYRIAEGAAPGGGGGGPRMASLDELIRRERFILNHAIRLARAPQIVLEREPGEIDRTIRLQRETAERTHELAEVALEAESLLGIVQERVSDLLLAAERAMLGAVDSLSLGKHDVAALQVRDALSYLVEARTGVEVYLGQGGSGADTLRAGDRRLLQKLRRSSTDAEAIKDLISQLRSLANRQKDISKTLDSLLDDAKTSPLTDSLPPVEDAQRQIRDDADLIHLAVQELDGASTLARDRAKRNLDSCATVVEALERGDAREASSLARDAGWRFDDLASQLAGVLLPDPTDRIAIARDLSSQIAVEGRAFAREWLNQRRPHTNVADATPGEHFQRSAEYRRALRRLIDGAATIDDVLDAVLRLYREEQNPTATRVEGIVNEGDLDRATVSWRGFDEQLARGVGDVAQVELMSAADGADRLEQRLDWLHRSLVAPKLEQLRGLELRAAALAEELDSLPSDAAITRWHQQADQLLRDLETSQGPGLAPKLQTALRDAAQTGSAPTTWNWPYNRSGSCEAPPAYRVAASELVTGIQRSIRELLLAGMYTGDAEAVPPEYTDLVQRYLEAISQSEAPSARKSD